MNELTDWASEITYKLAKGIAQTGRHAEMFFDAEEVAAAIRKARADGLREAADMIETAGREVAMIDGPILPLHRFTNFGMREIADKIEKGLS